MCRGEMFLAVLALTSLYCLGQSSANESTERPDVIHRRPLNLQLSFSPYEEYFDNFTRLFNKSYNSVIEKARRFEQFRSNLQDMEDHNLRYFKGLTTFFMGPNQFSDMSHDEYLQYNKLGSMYKPASGDRVRRSAGIQYCYEHRTHFGVPNTVDWRQEGAVTSVKDQGQCGSCWVFSANGAMEGNNYLSTGRLVDLSEQQVLDCCKTEHCGGCNGGDVTSAYQYASQYGLTTEDVYPYEAQGSSLLDFFQVQKSCHYSGQDAEVSATQCRMTQEGNEADLRNAVGTIGPVAVAVSAYHSSFMHYAGGVYYSSSCGNGVHDLDHGMLVVGYGTTEGKDYWLVKNSWGTTWGDEGYVYMSRNRDNNCGIATYASYAYTKSS